MLYAQTRSGRVDFAVPAGYRKKIKESEKRDKYSDLTREQRKLWNMRATVIPIVIVTLGTVPERVKNQRTTRDQSDNSIVEISQNTEKSPGDPRSLVTQTPVKDHLLTLV